MNAILSQQKQPWPSPSPMFDPKSRYAVAVAGTDGCACIVRGKLAAESKICELIFGEQNVPKANADEWRSIREDFGNTEKWTMDYNGVPFHWDYDTGEGIIHVWIVNEELSNA